MHYRTGMVLDSDIGLNGPESIIYCSCDLENVRCYFCMVSFTPPVLRFGNNRRS